MRLSTSLGHSIHVYSIYWRLNGALCYYIFNKYLLELGRGMMLHGRRANATWAQELPTSRCNDLTDGALEEPMCGEPAGLLSMVPGSFFREL